MQSHKWKTAQEPEIRRFEAELLGPARVAIGGARGSFLAAEKAILCGPWRFFAGERVICVRSAAKIIQI